MLKELGITPDIARCTEGRAAFVAVERMRYMVESRRFTFAEALEVVRASQLFTTHTPVPAGHDQFPEAMIRQYLAHYPDCLGITWGQFVQLGKAPGDLPKDKFSMSFLACNGSSEINGVSRVHCDASRRILRELWPGYYPDCCLP